METIKPGIYKHYKGKKYEVIGLASNQNNDGEINELIVVYRALYDIPELADQFGLRPLFTRSLSEFSEDITYEGKTIKRFAFVGSK